MRPALWAFVGALVVVAAGCGKARRDAVRVTNAGVRAYDRDDVQTAYNLFRRAVAIDPDYAPAHYHLGLVELYERHELAAARRALQRALELDPELVDARYHLGRLLLETGQLDAAEQQFEEVLRLAPDHSGALHHLGRIAEQRGQLHKANTLYRRAVTANPHDVAAFLALGNLYERVEAIDAAVQVYREAIRHNPDDADNRQHLARLLMLRGRAREAIEHLLTVEQLAPQRREVLFAIASAFLSIHDDGHAQDYLERYLAGGGAGMPPPRNAEVARVLLENVRRRGAGRAP